MHTMYHESWGVVVEVIFIDYDRELAYVRSLETAKRAIVDLSELENIR